MKVISDVSVIGLAQLYESARTGIYTFITQLMKELLRETDLDISVTSLSSTEVNSLTRSYFATRGYDSRYIGKNSLEDFLFNTSRSLLGTGYAGKSANRLIAKLFRNNRIAKVAESCDVFHSLYSPLPRFTGKKQPLSFLTLYDIIPVLHPEYFQHDLDANFKNIIASINSDENWILTISEASRNDIREHLRVASERIFVTYPAASTEVYFPVKDSTIINRIIRKYNIPESGYFLSLATLEFRKNLQMTVRCFQQIMNEPEMKNRSLVLAGTMGWKIDALLEEIQGDEELKKRIIITGYIADDDLAAVYSGAVAFLYPSLYEGFGLPPLEAMQCGIPVITSNNSSLPEVMGNAGIMVDPLDSQSICQAMLDLVNNGNLHSELARKGEEQARLFSWQRCARQTAEAYRQAYQTVH